MIAPGMTTTPARPSAAQCGAISALAVRLMVGLRTWCQAQGEGFRPDCVEATALSFASAAPWSTVAELLVPATVSLWEAGVDDRFDTQIATEAEAAELTRRCVAIAAGTGNADPADPVERSLASIIERLSELGDYDALRTLWIERVRDFVAAMLFEWRTSHGRIKPSLDEYLSQRDSFGLGPICVSWWMASAEPALSGRLDILGAAQQEASMAGRLVNDLVTVTREQAEGCKANALLLGATPTWAEQRIGHHLAHCHELLRPLVESGIRPAIALGRLVDWIVAFYQTTDPRIAAEE